MPLRRILGLPAAVSGRLRRGVSTAASHPPWAMIYHVTPVRSPSRLVSFQLAEPPCASHLFVPVHLLDRLPRANPDSDIVGIFGGMVSATSSDGLLLLDFLTARAMAPIVSVRGATRERRLIESDEPDITRFVCNPLSGHMFRLPDIGGMKKTSSSNHVGLLTRSAYGHGPPDRYAVARLREDCDGKERTFVMDRFLSQTGYWEKLVGVPSPLPLARRMDIYHAGVAFAGRLWWVDLCWGAVSFDPFSDHPELRFVELPRGSVLPEPRTTAEYIEVHQMQHEYRRMGVSEGRLHYVEVSQKEPFMLYSFSLDDDSSCWTLEHQVALGRLWAHGGQLSEEDIPRIGVIDPLNASVMHITIGLHALSVDMDKGEVLGCSFIGQGQGPLSVFGCSFIKESAYQLPPGFLNHVCSHRGLDQAAFLLQVIVHSQDFSDIHVHFMRYG